MYINIVTYQFPLLTESNLVTQRIPLGAFSAKSPCLTCSVLVSFLPSATPMAPDVPYSLKFSRIKYFVVWLNSAQKQIFADTIFVVEHESRKVHTYTTSTNFFAG